MDKPIAQIDAELSMWEARKENIRLSFMLLGYQQREVDAALAASQGEKLRAQAEIEAANKVTGE